VFPYWRRYELEFQPPDDLAAANSRLAFFLVDTGTLWLSDVVLTPQPTQEAKRQWWPRISKGQPIERYTVP